MVSRVLLLGLVLPRFSIFKGGLIVIGFLIISFAFAYWMYSHNYIINLIMPLLSVFFIFLFISMYKVFIEESEKTMIKGQFSKLVNKEVVDELLADPSRLR